MGDTRNYAALEWVIGEIGDTLKEARQALEAYVEDPKDSTRIRFCLTHIHQVHGTLQMVEFHGASLLAEEMEQLAQALMSNAVSSTAEAHEVLMRSLLQLPIYLDHVKNQRDDHPGVILPLLNDLRAVRKQGYLSETNLFAPDLSAAARVSGARHPLLSDHQKLKQLLGKLREMYQFSAAAVLRGVKLEENLGYLNKVCSRLESLTAGTRSHAVWQLAAALVQALERDDLELSVAMRGLLRHLARELRVLTERSPDAFDYAPRESLLKNLLYYAARAKNGGENLNRIKRDYQLDKALLFGDASSRTSDEDFISAPEPEAIRSVVVALQDELNTVKHILDISLTGQGGRDELVEVLPVVKRVADTLAVLGIGNLRKQIIEQHDHLSEICQAGDLDESRLMEVASQIIEIEHRLQSIAKGAGKNRDLSTVDERGIEIDYAKSAVLSECQKGLEKAKDAIVEYIASKWDVQHLADVSSLMSDIRGGLEMIPLPRPAAIVANCGRYVQEQLLDAQVTPDWTTLDSLADTIASIDYYLERLREDREEDLDHLLAIAEESMSALGYATSDADDLPAGAEGADAAPDDAAAAPAEASDSPVAPLPTAEHTPPQQDEVAAGGVQPVEQEPVSEAPPVEDAPLVEENIELTALDESDSEGPAGEPAASRDAAEMTAQEETQSREPAEPEPTQEAETVESDIDDEIIEIFVEEAGEVQETLAEFFPQWRQNPADDESLTTVRRAFHTLKGSGRMVEAFDVGELAWSVENMLNRVIDRTIVVQDEHFALIEMVLHILPDMVKAFEERSANPQKQAAQQYQEWAFALADGSTPAELQAAATRWEQGDRPQADQPVAAAMSEPDTGERNADTENASEPAVAPADADGSVQWDASEDDSDDDDLVLWEIFASEAETHLAAVEDFIAQMEAVAPIYTPPSDEMQRALHTLKGSAHMAHVTPIAELAAPFEGFVKELRSYQVNLNDDILQLIKDGVEYTWGGLACIAENRPVELPKLAQFLARTAELRELFVAPLVRQKEAERDGQKQVDPRLLSIFMAEEMKLLLDADKILERWQGAPANTTEIEPLVTELATLENGARHANLPDMSALSHALRQVYLHSLSQQQLPEAEAMEHLLEGHELLLDLVDAVAAGQNLQPVAPELLEGLQALVPADTAVAEEAESGPAAEETAEEIDFSQLPGDWETAEQAESSAEVTAADGEFSELDDAAVRDEDFGSDDEVAPPDITSDEESFSPEWQLATEEVNGPALESEPQETAEAAPDVQDQTPEPEDVPAQPAGQSDASEQDQGEADTAEPDDEQAAIPITSETAAPEVEDEHAVEETAAIELDEDYDPEIVEIFLEEAGELMDELDEAVHTWESDWSNAESPDTMARALHTLKGGARLAGLMDIGQLTHEYETFLLGRSEDAVDDHFFKKIQAFQDKTLRMIKNVAAALAGEAEPASVSADADDTSNASAEKPAEATAPAPAAPSSAKVVPFAPKPKEPAPTGGGGGFSMPPAAGGGGGGGQATAQVARRSGPQEVIKISAELLEELVNLAGETSISRGRLETQINDLSGAVDEIDGTISRLQEQLRRLDIETEAQIIFRQEQMAELEDFDPLEMDRYSQLQQLSRSLIESASDLVDLKSTLTDKIKDTETLLLQQSRVNTNLQEGLMRSRMVPFSRLVPRLRRIVRQVAAELGKNVNFELDNIEGEMDRSVLERMVAPLEHMLRNAVDHGIEKPEERATAGKPETGRVVLSLAREGSDVLLRLVDDGRGINLRRVREKAIERGLMSADAQLSDHDIMQFILHAGFSTADSVTQISGRGVGMDVVHAEIKQLGGSMTIASRAGEGTEFSVRLPFTVSVNRALMVNLGQDQYAIPLNAIEGIVRVSPFELEHYYSNPDARFEYAGENFQVRYLGSMLRDDARPRLDAQSLPLPVILVRSEQHTMALQVDSLMGSREIVVKSLGQQFSAVQGLSGATVMGDGSVVVILDLHALVRKDIAQAAPTLAFTIDETARLAQQASEALKTVMVVDDSVTVRKVTSRFLEREGYNVITAKDGIDALRILQDEIPDVMLLDIEMPRMDGFEVAKNIRTTSRWQDIPIIMITSRTGEKHREHALSLGVNRYMGKPYQEDALLESISELLEQ